MQHMTAVPVRASRAAPENMLFSGMLEASSAAVEEWMLSPEFDAKLFCYFPCADLTPDLASQASTTLPLSQ